MAFALLSVGLSVRASPAYPAERLANESVIVLSRFMEAVVVDESGNDVPELRAFVEKPSRARRDITTIFLATGDSAVYVQRFSLSFGAHQAFEGSSDIVPFIRSDSPSLIVQRLKNREKILAYMYSDRSVVHPSVKVVIRSISYK
jgi:hypothetical protein